MCSIQKCLKEILSNADVVLSTLTGASQEGVMKYGIVIHSTACCFIFIKGYSVLAIIFFYGSFKHGLFYYVKSLVRLCLYS